MVPRQHPCRHRDHARQAAHLGTSTSSSVLASTTFQKNRHHFTSCSSAKTARMAVFSRPETAADAPHNSPRFRNPHSRCSLTAGSCFGDFRTPRSVRNSSRKRKVRFRYGNRDSGHSHPTYIALIPLKKPCPATIMRYTATFRCRMAHSVRAIAGAVIP